MKLIIGQSKHNVFFINLNHFNWSSSLGQLFIRSSLISLDNRFVHFQITHKMKLYTVLSCWYMVLFALLCNADFTVSVLSYFSCCLHHILQCSCLLMYFAVWNMYWRHHYFYLFITYKHHDIPDPNSHKRRHKTFVKRRAPAISVDR